jgi:hypothetical protein
MTISWNASFTLFSSWDPVLTSGAFIFVIEQSNSTTSIAEFRESVYE